MPKLLNEQSEMVAISRLIPHPANVNEGDYGAIEESIKANGFFGALVVQRSTRHICAGNHRYLVAKDLGYSELPVCWVDVDDEQALRILLADNRTARLGHDNEAALADLLAELANTEQGLVGTGFDGDDLDQLINDLAGQADSGLLEGVDPDEVPTEAEARCKAGDLWQLGEHRLLCGDSESPHGLKALIGIEDNFVFGDPPYEMDAGVQARLIDLFGGVVAWFGNFPTFADIIRQSTKHVCYDIAWLTGGRGLLPNPNFIIPQHKNILIFSDKLPVLNFDGARHLDKGKLCSVIQAEYDFEKLHKHEKPMPLILALIDSYANKTVIDPFAGSGATIIACEMLGKTCRAQEIDPACCDIIIARWENATGKRAELEPVR